MINNNNMYVVCVKCTTQRVVLITKKFQLYRQFITVVHVYRLDVQINGTGRHYGLLVQNG